VPSLIRLCSAICAVIFIFGLGSVPAAAEDCSPVSFNVAPTFGTEKNPASVAVADFNKDGKPDMAVANAGAHTFSIFDGDGEGAFKPPRSFPVGIVTLSFGTVPRSVAVSDFNADGNLDLVVVGGFTSGWVSILLGDGAGNFASGINQTLGNNVNANAVVVGDFNGDNKPDIAVAGGSSRKVSFLLGYGTGAFVLAGQVLVTSDPDAITTGDFNGDGITDVAVTGRYFDWNSSIILGNLAGTFTLHHTFSMHWAPYSIASADFNGDGRADLAITYSWSSPEHGVAILLGDGTGRFGPAHEIFIGYEPASVITGDFNADGKKDLAVSVSGANNVAILQGNGTGTFSPPKYYGTAVAPSRLAAADFNNDGKLDLTSVHPASDVLSILLGDGAGAFASTTTELMGGGQVAAADFNGDGLLDLAATGFSNIGTFLSNGAGGFHPPSYHQVVNYPKSIVTQDFNNDGKADLAVGHEYSTSISILLGDGTGHFSSHASFSLEGGSGVLTGGDFNGDNKADLAILTNNFAGTLGQVAILTGNGNGFFSTPAHFAAGSVPNALTAADLNADGRLDLAVNNSYLGTVTVLLNDGGGSFSQPPYSPLRAAPKVDFITAADLNRDGLPDLITANDEPHTVSILLNNGSGFAAVKTLTFNPGSSPRSVRVGDFNADGNPDLVVSVHNFFSDYFAGNVAIYTGDGAGNFSAPTFFTAGGGARDFVFGDFNRDGKPDIAVAGTPITSPNLTVLLNTFASQPCLTVNDVSVTEGDAGTTSAVFTVTLSAASAETVKVNYFLRDNTAKKGVDYELVSGRLEFAPGETTKNITVLVINDTLDEFDKNFSFVLSNPAHAVIGKSQASGTILDNDPEPVITVNDVSNTEASAPGGFASILFTATLSAPSAKQISFNHVYSGGTATLNTDYYPQTFTTITFPAGTTTMRFGVTIATDDDYEPDETILIDLTNAVNATFARTRIQGTILNDDAPPFITIDTSRVFAPEGNSGTTDFPVSVQLSGASYQTITVNYSTVDGSAVAGSDYVAASGSLTFAPGERSKSFSVPIIGDTIDELDKTFAINLSGATNATIDPPQTVMLIRDDDGPNISINDVSVAEGDTGTRNATFTITLSATSPQPVGVVYITSDGTATGGSDYARSFGRFVSVPAGQTSATFNISIVGDLNVEPDETFNVNLSNPSGGTILDAQGVCTIINDDVAASTLQFSAASYSVNEDANATLTITRTGDKTGTATVKYQTVDDPAAVPCDPDLKRPDGSAYPHGAAYARCDYATSVDTLTFLPGEESKQLTVPLIDDVYAEGAETVQVRLFDAVGAVLPATGNSTATLTIQDNDATTGTENPSRTTAFFVRLHYLDFLSREPEAGEPWSRVLNNCPNAFNLDPANLSAACDRLIVSQSFFGAPEFRLKGLYTYTFYRVAFERRPAYEEIIPDMRSVTGQSTAEVYQKRSQFPADFAGRTEFKARYDALSHTAYVNTLLDRYQLPHITTPDPQQPEGGTKVSLSRADLINRLSATGAQSLTRAQVLRAIVESDEVGAIEYKGAFVAMQYYGYLRRTPEESGYQAWLKVITEDPNNIRIMVNGFLNSTEYRIRFGRP
jgi:Calx-beta domain/FG-GAP-like repeat